MKIATVFFLCMIASCLNISTSPAFAGTAFFQSDEHAKKIIKRIDIERQAEALEKRGQFSSAIDKYQEAMAPSLLNEKADAAAAHDGISRIYQKNGQFELALKEFQWFMGINANSKDWIDRKLELEALVKARDTHSPQPVLNHIVYLKDKYNAFLPPKKFMAGMTDTISSAIIRLYDHIGDQDGGIAFCDEMLRYWEKKSGQDLHRPGNKNQYFLIRQAFEQDKKEGFKGCLDAKPGDACMGRATKALIQSDYFPW